MHAMQFARREPMSDRSRLDAEGPKLLVRDDAVLAERERRDLPIQRGWADLTTAIVVNSAHPPEGRRPRVTADPGVATNLRRYSTRNVASDVSRATIEPPLSRASSRYSTASRETRKPSRITGIPGG